MEVPTRTIENFCGELAIYSLCYTPCCRLFSRSLTVRNEQKIYGTIQLLFRETKSTSGPAVARKRRSFPVSFYSGSTGVTGPGLWRLGFGAVAFGWITRLSMIGTKPRTTTSARREGKQYSAHQIWVDVPMYAPPATPHHLIHVLL